MSTTIACLGEVLLRLSTPDQLLLSQSNSLDLHMGGAETNVGVALARAGHRVQMLSLLPDNALGYRCRDELRRHGVDTSRCRFVPGRMGLYFITPGVANRPAQVIYDREHSVFAEQAIAHFNTADALQGIDWLHVSGVSAALTPELAAYVPTLLHKASSHGVVTSFDCNYRAKLWNRWQGDAASCFRACAEHAQILFADARSLGLILDVPNASALPSERFAELSEQAMQRMPGLRHIACTRRTELSASHHRLGARLRTRTQLIELEQSEINPIVDRIGGGDAFAAGLLHGLLSGHTDEAALRFALAASCLKHSIRGDVNLAEVQEIEQSIGGGWTSVMR